MSETQGTTTVDIRERVGALLQSGLDRGALLRELGALAREPGFDDCANLWAPALYERDSDFFERFLLRHLSGRQAATIRALLPRIEADTRDDLFRRLYARITRPEAWNADLLALAASSEPDEWVLAAVERRRLTGYWFVLDGETALALYRRNPALFGDFVANSTRTGPQTSEGTYDEVLAEAERRGDTGFFWQVFRQVAGPDEWEQAVRQLLTAPVPSDAIMEELRRRHPVFAHDLNSAVLAELLAMYGAAVLPYIEENANWISRRGAPRLLATAERLGDEELYWRVFFRVGNARDWNAALIQLARQPLAASDWAAALRLRMPPAGVAPLWGLAPAGALALYRRDAALARPLIEDRLADASLALFEEAEQTGDEDLLDLLTTRLVMHLSSIVYDAYPSPSEAEYKSSNPEARAQLEKWERAITGRLDRLYDISPAIYVEHATRILSRLEPSGSWSFRRNLDRNPAFTYLYRRYHHAWLVAPSAVRELLETPNPLAQGIALEILSEGGPEAADRAVENLPLLHAMLLGDGGRGAKKRVLFVLEQAARQGPSHAEAILPALHEAMYFRATDAVADRAMVSYVRLRSQLPQAVETSSSAFPTQL
ncbi:MAG: hypothetical protein ACLQUY_28530 [Ktedonobacterales bacterium]